MNAVRTVFNAVKGLPECHLSKNVKGNHFEPIRHVQSFRGSLQSDLPNEVVHTLLDDMLLLSQCLRRECGR